MSKSNKILITLISFVLIMLVSISVCHAADYADASEVEGTDLKMESLEVTSPKTGIYGVGTEVDITIKFNKKVKGTLPKLAISFGNSDANKVELDEIELTTFTDTATYKYTIKSGDNGKLYPDGFVNTSNYQIETEDGSKYYLSSPFGNFANNIYADTTIVRADLSNATFEWVADQTNHNGLRLKMKDATTVEGNEYRVHLSHNKDENLTVLDFDSIYDNLDVWSGHIGLENVIDDSKHNTDKIVSEKGDIYISICEIDGKYNIPKILIKGQKIERLEQLPLGSRLKAFFFNDYTSTYCWETTGKEDRKINVKIGTISDKTILKSIKNGESGCLDRLLAYAKTAQSIYTGTVPVGDSKEIVSSMNLVDDGYYYVYMQLEDENGKYYPVEDVSLYQAMIGDTIGKNLCDYLDSDFKWNLEEEPIDNTQKEPVDDTKKDEPIDNTVASGKLPQTGISCGIVFAIIMVVGIGIITLKKYRNLKDI